TELCSSNTNTTPTLVGGFSRSMHRTQRAPFQAKTRWPLSEPSCRDRFQLIATALIATAFMPDDDFTKPPFPNGHIAAASAIPAKPQIAIVAVVAVEATEIAIVPIAAVRSHAQVQL